MAASKKTTWIGAVTEAGREETRVAAREVDSSVSAEPMMAVGGYGDNMPSHVGSHDSTPNI